MAGSDSVSPGTRSPVSADSQTPTTNGVHGIRKLGTEVNGTGETHSSTASVKFASQPPIEADDYMNQGLPHENGVVSIPPPPSLNSPRLHSALKIIPAYGTPSHERRQSTSDPTTPPPITGRRSVQFVRSNTGGEVSGHTRHDSWGAGDGDMHRGMGQTIMEKLKLLASPHLRGSNSGSLSEDVVGTSSQPYHPGILEEEGSDMDADAEETADEEGLDGEVLRIRRKRRTRRPPTGSHTAPSTPKIGSQANGESFISRPSQFLRRRATDGMEDQQRGGVSEGEGRDRLGKESAWRRGSSWISGARGQSYSLSSQPQDTEGTPTGRRPNAFRRAVTTFGAASDGDGTGTPRRPFISSERGATFGAHKWRQLKHGLKLLGQRKEEHKIDYLKSAELMAELRAGAPAALMFASMIQRDEHGNKRIPVLLEQLKLKITDSKSVDDHENESDRHMIFRIELEYGSGLNRMKWVINRSLRDFVNLHLRYKLQRGNDKYLQLKSDVNARPKQPHFPGSTFPYLRGVRGLGDSSDEEGENPLVEDTAGEATYSEGEGKKRKKKRPSMSSSRRKSTVIETEQGSSVLVLADGQRTGNKAYNLRQRKKLEQYLLEMIRWLIFRADSNRLCKFLELSSLGVRLAAEGSYHGKEGFLVIQSAGGLDFRRMLTPSTFVTRHSPKWFLVRHSYIVCVEGPENMVIYDVFFLDSSFELQSKRRKVKEAVKEAASKDFKNFASSAKSSATKHHSLKLQNSERRIKLLASSERMVRQFEESIRYMMANSIWAEKHRFDSFAPVRTGVYAQWLVDGRDYMWNVSRAINMAKDVIYIHDWWLSPQLYMRRPAAISQKWRLDRLLRKKAREGVKIFIIIYRNVEAAIPIDSEFTKFSMLDLHPNIFVQRSPNQYKKNQFFFAHHEKICIVDHTVAFVGGIDLCFGRWDTPQHTVVDDKPTGFEQTNLPKDADHCQLWPGKDYSNPRVQDFYQLTEPYAEMYDRTKVPRMPWHDVGMQVVGQPARDMTRHFVQRWNYILRGRKSTRPTPFLLPPPDYNPADLEALGLTGTCEVQILRSASEWSLGLTKAEHSIMNAYCKMIEESDHFVYIENQFFITSCETMGVKIVNKIGDAIVERAQRASRNNENWRCVILIPLMPGFQNTVDEPEGTSVRLIMQCQFRSICRGNDSIFGRLRSEGIEPEDFVHFYSLRSWGKIGPNKALVTEQLYIHAKVIIVDDRIALIGSANINERSMLGNRDSECAAVVRDTDMINSTMDGNPYLVGRFAHTLRMRLMREHLGLDVDEVMEEERRTELDREEAEYDAAMDKMYDDDDRGNNGLTEAQIKNQTAYFQRQESAASFNHNIDWDLDEKPTSSRFGVTTDSRVIGNKKHAADLDGESKDAWKAAASSGIDRGRDSILVDGVREVLVSNIAPEGKGTFEAPTKPHGKSLPVRPTEADDNLSNDLLIPPPPHLTRKTTEELGLTNLSLLPTLPIIDDTDIGGPRVIFDESGQPTKPQNSSVLPNITQINVHKDCMRDPLNDTFFEDTWRQIADNNTKIFRQVFRCNPDSEATTWLHYREFTAYGERFSQSQTGLKNQNKEAQDAAGKNAPTGASTSVPGAVPLVYNLASKMKSSGEHEHPLGSAKEWADVADAQNKARPDTSTTIDAAPPGDGAFDEKRDSSSAQPFPPLAIDPPHRHTTVTVNGSEDNGTRTVPTPNGDTNQTHNNSTRRRRRGTSTKKGFSASDDLMSYSEAEKLLGMVQGHLVNFPYDWLSKEEDSGNWLYQVDQVAPLQIYD